MTDILLSRITNEIPELEIKYLEPMREYCSFRIGGPARAIALPRRQAELLKLYAIVRELAVSPLVIGKGTNLLVSDEGTGRLVIRLSDGFDDIKLLPDGCIEAQSGITLARLAAFARDNGLSGLEFAHGIPGTLGGAVFMNAGAYGGEMKDVLVSATFIDSDSGQVRTLDLEGLELGYRCSRFSKREDVIVSAVLKLHAGEPEKIAATMKELSEKRRASQPLNVPSAGSTFKRPEIGYAAAMIDECGLKGYSVGAAQVSPKHAGFVVNNGGASYADVRALMAHVQETVLREKGVRLEPEVRIIAD